MTAAPSTAHIRSHFFFIQPPLSLLRWPFPSIRGRFPDRLSSAAFRPLVHDMTIMTNDSVILRVNTRSGLYVKNLSLSYII